MRKHRDAVTEINAKHVPADLYAGAKQAWDEAVELGEDFGYRNAQATVLAPTGTIGFMMDCDTTGVEPDIALVKYKKLVGGGLMKIVNGTVPMALEKLGYTKPEIEAIVHYIDEHETIEGAPFLKDEHLPVFDCAFKAAQGRAVDPLHGPHPDDGRHAAVHLGRDQQDRQRAARGDGRGHREGLHRVVAARRQGDLDLPRRQQAHAAAQHVEGRRGRHAQRGPASRCAKWCKEVVKIVETPKRRKLPDERNAITHKFDIAGHEGYITVGLFEDGTPGEIFLVMAKEGLDDLGLCRRVRAGDLLRAAVRRAAAGAGRQVQPRALRAVGDDEEPRGPVREVDRRLHLPLDGDEVPVAGSAVPRRREHARGACARTLRQ